MKRHKIVKLPPENEAEIKKTAEADSLSYDDELERLSTLRLQIPENFRSANDAFLIAQLAYLRNDNRGESAES